MVGVVRGGLASLEQKPDAHPLSVKDRDKKADIEIARGELQAIVSELEDAKKRLGKGIVGTRHGRGCNQKRAGFTGVWQRR